MSLTDSAHAALMHELRAGIVDIHRSHAGMLRRMANGPLGQQDGATALDAAANVIDLAARMIEASELPERQS